MDQGNRTYKRLIDYVKQEVQAGRLRPGDRLPTERDLALRLEISRNSVREGLRLLENMGILYSRQGSGNYLSSNFDHTMAEMLAFMYFIKGMNDRSVTEFRWAIERAALPLAIERIDADEKSELEEMIIGLEKAPTEQKQIFYDRELHRIIVRACRNDFLIASYEALTDLMDTYIQTMRAAIIEQMESRNELESAHDDLAYGVIRGDLPMALSGLEKHYTYINQYKK